MEDSRLLPPQYQLREGGSEAAGYTPASPLRGRQAEDDRARAVSDYIAGMTDRYAIREHRRIFAVEEI